MFAERIIPLPAIPARHTGHQRHACHPVTRLYSCYSFSHFLHRSRKLMSENIRKIMAGIPVYPRDIRTADAGIFYLDNHLSRLRRGFRNLLIPNIIFCVNNSCFHLFILSVTVPDMPVLCIPGFLVCLIYFLHFF